MLMTIKLAFVAAVTIGILDFLWLTIIAKKFYIEGLSAHAQIVDGAIQPVAWAAGVVYVLLMLGVVFVVLPMLQPDSSYLEAFVRGAFVGLVIYGVYDFTNLATLREYPVSIAVVDTAWGAFVVGTASLAAKAVRDWNFTG